MRRFTEQSWRTDPRFAALCSALLACKSQEEVARLLRDIGTLAELQAWSERLEIAKQLARGLSYRQVAENTGASTTTVTRVARFIESGEGGYRKMIRAKSAAKNDVPLSPTENLQQKMKQHHAHAQTPRGERRASMLQKYLK